MPMPSRRSSNSGGGGGGSSSSSSNTTMAARMGRRGRGGHADFRCLLRAATALLAVPFLAVSVQAFSPPSGIAAQQQQQQEQVRRTNNNAAVHPNVCYEIRRTTTTTTATKRVFGTALYASSDSAASSSSSQYNALQPNDTVVVIGGTSGVGQLVTRKLCASACGYKVKVTSRDVAKAQVIAGDGVEVCPVDLVANEELSGVDIQQQLQEALDGAHAVVISVGTTAFPTIKWRGGNTPTAIDKIAIGQIARVASTIPSLKKIVLVTSVGIERTKEMPFLVLNLFGVLDAKKEGEQAIIRAASQSQSQFHYVIIRPGRLVGGPFTNLDIAKLLQIQGGAENGVNLALGDSLLGDCKRDACAEAVVQALLSPNCGNVAFSIISNEQKRALSQQEWDTEFQKLSS